MIKLVKPTSDIDRLELLEKAKTTGEQDIAAGRKYLLDETILGLTTFNPIYKAAQFLVNTKKEGRLAETAEQKAAFAILEVFCRDLMTVVKKRIYRMKEPLAVLAFYQMTQTGDIPNPTNMKQWLNLAEALIQGDAAAVLAGYPAMINPTAVELQAVLTTAQAEFDDVAMADRDYDIAQEALAVERTTADEWIDEIIDELDFSLRKFDDPSRRRIMRTYGFKYESDSGEEELPAKPDNFIHQWHDPDLTLTCDAVPTATNYEMVYTTDDVNWLPLYSGVDPTYTYAPPVGRRTYKIRAENEFGFGEWSDPVEFTVTEVPE